MSFIPVEFEEKQSDENMELRRVPSERRWGGRGQGHFLALCEHQLLLPLVLLGDAVPASGSSFMRRHPSAPCPISERHPLEGLWKSLSPLQDSVVQTPTIQVPLGSPSASSTPRARHASLGAPPSALACGSPRAPCLQFRLSENTLPYRLMCNTTFPYTSFTL